MKSKLVIYNTITNTLMIFILIFGGVVWADDNCIWHRAEVVVSGTFGSDQGNGNFTFPNNLEIKDSVDVKNNLVVNSDVNQGTEIDSDLITNNVKTRYALSQGVSCPSDLNCNGYFWDIASATVSAINLRASNNVNVGNDLVVSDSVTARVFYYNSDEKLKHNIKTIEDPIEKVQNLRGVKFNWNSDNSSEIGLIAQEVEEVLPELVSTNRQGKAVNYNGIIGLLVECIKQQQVEINALKNSTSNPE